jgi:quercetin dioxygenase-like cupin family protein
MQSAIPANEFWFLNGRVRIALAKADNAEGISILEHWMPHGDAPPLHIHHAEDEVFMILEGEMKFRVGDRTIIGRAGDVLCAPRGVPHAYRVTSHKGAHAYTITGGGFEDMVRSMSRPAEGASLPEFTVPSPALQQALGAACAAQQIELIGPPLE